MRICGMGTVFARGRGVSGLEETLLRGWVAPAAASAGADGARPGPAFRIDSAILKEKSLSRHLRRADRFSKIAVLAAWDAASDGGAGFSNDGSVGIILATAFGPHVTTFKFLDDILDYGDLEVSPTVFSHSVHNAAVSYIAKVLNVQGPTQTVTHFAFSFHQALALAQAWLDEGRCSHVLVGAADECGAVLETICGRMLRIDGEGRINPFAFSPMPAAVPGEGSVFFLVTNRAAGASYGRISLLKEEDPVSNGKPDLMILDADGMAGDESVYGRSLLPGVPAAAYSPLFGSMMTGSAFSCAVAALMMRNRVVYPNPVVENPHNIPLCDGGCEAELDRVLCIKHDCAGKRTVIELKRDPEPQG
jgi:3-oxoacyl-[acyl-carrier-protein] synthase II